jgi:hypothetical protein
VAELLAVSPETVLGRWRAGELPGFRLASNVLRFSEHDIDAWLDARRLDIKVSHGGFVTGGLAAHPFCRTTRGERT